MNRLLWGCLLLSIALTGWSQSPFEGTYLADDDDMVVLELSQQGNRVEGTLDLFGESYSVIGNVDSGALEGTLSGQGERLQFRAEPAADGGLSLLIEDPEMAALGAPPQLLYFRSQSADGWSRTPEPGDDPAPAADAPVTINGQALSLEQVQSLAATYGQSPMPGDYWYDSLSGLYGVRGYQAFGFMFPGHEFGPLEADASSGESGVFVNGRQLPQLEWLIWSQMLGYPIQMGRYWLDAQGNAGYEGNPIPVDNLYLAAQRNAAAVYGGGSGGGDNFWTSRFSAGNYDQGNSRGYVSVPGHGPVGYGF